MNKEEYAQLHYLLAKIKYEEMQTLVYPNLSDPARKQVKNIINAIDEIERVCILEGSSNAN